MKTYQALKAEIIKLEQKAQALRRIEIAKVVRRLKQTIAEHGLTAADLGLARVTGRKASRGKGTDRGSQRATGTVGVPKFRNPKTGETWTGRGRPPMWIAGAKNRAAFLIPVGPAVPEGKASKPAAKANGARRAKAVPAKKQRANRRKTAAANRKAAVAPGRASLAGA